MDKPEIIDFNDSYIKLWEKYLDNVDKLSDQERELFCKFMENKSEPLLHMPLQEE